MRSLVLLHEGAPVLVSVTATPIHKRILEMPGDDADLWSIWSVPTDDSLSPPADITEQFALTWALDYKFGNGIERDEILAPYPPFIREIAGDKLIAKWRAEVVAALPITPNPLRRRAA